MVDFVEGRVESPTGTPRPAPADLTRIPLPYWLTSMQVDDQVRLTGSVVVLAQVRLRRPELAAVLNELSIVDTSSPAIAAARARELGEQFSSRPVRPGPDGLDDNWRIASLALGIEELIAAYYPEAAASSGMMESEGE